MYYLLNVMLCYAMLCCVTVRYATLRYAMLCYAMLCYVMLCYVMLCFILNEMLPNIYTYKLCIQFSIVGLTALVLNKTANP